MNAPGARDSEPSLQVLDTGQRTVAREAKASTLNCTGDSRQGGGGSKVLTHSALCPPEQLPPASLWDLLSWSCRAG